MILKKLNAVCSLLLSLVLLGHLGTMSYSMISGWYDYTICKTLAHMTAGIAVVHIILSLIIVFFFTDGGGLKRYSRQNRSVIVQRASGLVIILMLHFHIQAFGFFVTGEALSAGTKLGLLLTEYIFFIAICSHLSVSFSHALISLGLLRSETAEKKVNMISGIVFSVILVVIIFALTLCVVSWTGFAG